MIKQGPCVHANVVCDPEDNTHIQDILPLDRPGKHSKCKGGCPIGVGGQNCNDCLPGFWGYTSFGCRGNV